MVTIIELESIKAILKDLDIVKCMEEAFIQYSNGKAVVPPVAELLFDDPPGDVHIKYGYIKDSDYYCIKIASGFYENPKLGISSSQGMMLLFNRRTGQPVAVLLDEGHLTDIRTAAAGALVAKYFAPKKIHAIGIIGTGGQARFQLQYLQQVTPCRDVWVWGRSLNSSMLFKNDFADEYNINIAASPGEVAHKCNLIVTTTPSKTTLLEADDIQAGTHITAMGSDTSDKQELESDILQKADIVISDSIAQSKNRGEIYQAIRQNMISYDKVIELGYAIQNKNLLRSNDQQISIADLTGVAVQDIMITTSVFTEYINKNK